MMSLHPNKSKSTRIQTVSQQQKRSTTIRSASFQILTLLISLLSCTTHSNNSNSNSNNGCILLFVQGEFHITHTTFRSETTSSRVVVGVLFNEAQEKLNKQSHFMDDTSFPRHDDKDNDDDNDAKQKQQPHEQEEQNNTFLSSVLKIENIVMKQGGFNQSFGHERWFNFGGGGSENYTDTLQTKQDENIISPSRATKRATTVATTESTLSFSLEIDQVMFTSPHGVLTTQNYIFVSDSYRNVIEKRNVDGVLLETYGDGSKKVLNFPTGMAFWDDILYICDSKNHRIVRMDIHTGDFINSFGLYGLDVGLNFDFPRDITFDSKGCMYIAEAGNRRIQKFAANGDFQFAFNGACGTMKKLRGSKYDSEQCRAKCGAASGVAVDQEDNVYVSFPDKSVVVKYNSMGQEVYMYGKVGITNREFQAPLSVSVDSAGHLYVVDSVKGWLTIFEGHNRFLGMYHGSRRPSYVAIDTSDNSYIVDFPI